MFPTVPQKLSMFVNSSKIRTNEMGLLKPISPLVTVNPVNANLLGFVFYYILLRFWSFYVNLKKYFFTDLHHFIPP